MESRETDARPEQFVAEWADSVGRYDPLSGQDDWSNRNRRDSQAERLAHGLGWLSIGLGLGGILAPKRIARFLGTRDHGMLFRLMGLCEVASGIGILTRRRPAGLLWARVGGDVIDLIALRNALASERAKPANIAIASLAVGAIAALDARCAQQLTQSNGARPDSTIEVTKTILINRPPEVLYRYWRDFANLPRFMKNLECVEVTASKISRWTAKGPAGAWVRWDAEITEDRAKRCHEEAAGAARGIEDPFVFFWIEGLDDEPNGAARGEVLAAIAAQVRSDDLLVRSTFGVHVEYASGD